APMLLDTSTARMTVPAVRGTGTIAAGPAPATASTPSPAIVNPTPRYVRRPPGTATPAAARTPARRRADTTTPHPSATVTISPTTNTNGELRLMNPPPTAPNRQARQISPPPQVRQARAR